MRDGYVSGVAKIAVLRANGLGDLIFCLPALRALRDCYPKAELVLLGQGWHKAFLSGRDVVDRVIEVPPPEHLSAEEAEPLLADLRRQRSDIAPQRQR